MAKLETKTWETKRLSKFEIRVTPKKFYVDRIDLETGKSEVAMYIQVQELYSIEERGVTKKYFASIPFATWCNAGTSFDSMLRFIKQQFDIDVPQDAIDLFESRNMMRELCETK